MAKKILLGMLLVAMLGAIGGAGYQFGRYLRESGRAAAAPATG